MVRYPHGFVHDLGERKGCDDDPVDGYTCARVTAIAL
jgi:hypothetical protein